MTLHTRPGLVLAAVLGTLLLGAEAGSAQEQVVRSAPLRRLEGGFELRPRLSPPAILDGKAVGTPLAELRAAREVASAELEGIKRWNRAGQKPARNGFSRALPAPRRVDFTPSLWRREAGAHAGGFLAKQADQSLAWAATVKVAGAYRARLHLSEVDLPAGALLWVAGEGETFGPFGLELRDDEGGLWTPSVAGELVRLMVQVPSGASAETGFVVDQVLEILGGDLPSGNPELLLAEKAGACLVNAQCVDTTTFDVIEAVRRAVAHIEFVDTCPAGVTGNCGYVCSGGLLNPFDEPELTVPYFLTANHCFSTQKTAASLEAFFDFFSSSCSGPAPALGSLPRSNGSTLLVSQKSTDVTLVRLNSIPALRYLLGWTNAAVPLDTPLHRLSHPCDPNFTEACRPLPQQYSRSRVDVNAVVCPGVTRPAFLYQRYLPEEGDVGGTFGGSSGSPLMIDGGRVVGQLLGGCGSNPLDGCDYASNSDVDGAFRLSYPALAKFIDPLPSTCVADAFTACLVGGRFKVTFDYRSPQGLSSRGRVATAGTDNSALFYFANASNWEMLIKVLDGCPVNQRKWVFYAATTNLDFTLTVTDTTTGQSKAYANPQGQAALPVQDTSAFDFCP